MNNFTKFIKKHSSAILTGMSIIGVGITTGLAINSTIKAVKIIEDKTVELTKHEKIYADNNPYTVAIPPKFTKKDILYYTWKQYIPVAVSGLSTILCIIGVHNLNRRTQASLISAYALLDNTYKEYKKKIQEEYPDDPKVVDFEHEIIKSKFDKNIQLDKNKQLFFDYQSMRYFESTLKEVKEAEQHLNDCLAEDGYVCLNEMYDFLELPKTPYGWQLGWSYIYSDTIYSEDDIKLKFEYEPITMDDGLECTIITIKYPKTLEYLC